MIITFFKEDAKGSFWYYSVHDRQGNLFTEYALTVVWGREPNAGREKVHLYDSARDMDCALRTILRKKVSQGYKVLYRFARNKRYIALLDEFDVHVV
ncbi:WGR domain-containing protein [Marispirochaeta sp.]|jgi:predicted DNA-binding WGR domain protein|uniref:WGR domain-containing protein n=1 Tax=Marispirochaeta sp. TaxID=2038653 RepID=UPI0029C5FEB8|nr:WGR domain-containing protein [Marispirochaeta sp.]